MYLIDSHSHLFLPEFDDDRDEVIQRAKKHNIKKILLPNIDSSTLPSLMQCCEQYKDLCVPLIGLHPGSVDANFESELENIYQAINKNHPAGIGEIGLDFYWDTTFQEEQKTCFEIQLQWAKRLKLPVAIHVRNSHDDVISIIQKQWDSDLKGVFHCFTGDYLQAQKILDLGFYVGIGGIVTFKNSGLKEVVRKIPVEKILLETDAPYLSPMPYRGKRNESSYLIYILDFLSGVYSINKEELSQIFSENTVKLFNLDFRFNNIQ